MSQQVDFYGLSSTDEQSRMLLVCRLADKIYKLGHSIFVLTSDESQSKVIDDLMWTFSQSSFLPHARIGNGANDNLNEQPVLIHHQQIENQRQVLINLTTQLPDTQGVERIVEVVNGDSQIKSSGREKYRQYQSISCDLKYHNLSA